MPKRKKPRSVTITYKSYGKQLLGRKIYYEGYGARPPSFLHKDGSFALGKTLLESLIAKGKFSFTFSKEQPTRALKRGTNTKYIIKESDYQSLSKRKYAKRKNIDVKVVNSWLSEILPTKFSIQDQALVYEEGIFSNLLGQPRIDRKLSERDKNAIYEFYKNITKTSSFSGKTVKDYLKTKSEQLISILSSIAEEIDEKILKNLDESEWQKYLGNNILVLQEGYIEKIEKQNISINFQFPDFCLVTSDYYLDIFEIKTPKAKLLSYDKSRKNYFFTTAVSKAISQVEKYIDSVTKNTDSLRNVIRDKYGIELRIIKPRGVIIIGNSSELNAQEKKDDFRMLANGLKNISIITFSDLAQSVRNKMSTVSELTASRKSKKK